MKLVSVPFPIYSRTRQISLVCDSNYSFGIGRQAKRVPAILWLSGWMVAQDVVRLEDSYMYDISFSHSNVQQYLWPGKWTYIISTRRICTKGQPILMDHGFGYGTFVHFGHFWVILTVIRLALDRPSKDLYSSTLEFSFILGSPSELGLALGHRIFTTSNSSQMNFTDFCECSTGRLLWYFLP